MKPIFGTIQPVPRLPPNEVDFLSRMEMQRGASVLTMGQEIEQKSENWFKTNFESMYHVNILEYLQRKRKGHPDFNRPYAPYEWMYGPFKNPSTWLHYFFDVDFNAKPFPWSNENDSGRSCGCHIHFAPICSNMSADEAAKVWTITYNTIIEMHLFLYPFAIFTPVARDDLGRFATVNTNRYGVRQIRRIIEAPRLAYREFSSVTFNEEEQNKPLTIEYRVPESPPVFLGTIERLMMYFIRNALKHGYSPKLTPDSRERMKRVARNIENRDDVYDCYSGSGPIEFKRLTVFDLPHMNNRRKFKNAREFVDRMCYYLMSLYPKARRNKDYFFRCLWFVYNQGYMDDEQVHYHFSVWWECFQEQQFQWSTVPEFVELKKIF